MTYEIIMIANRRKRVDDYDRRNLEKTAKQFPDYKKCETIVQGNVGIGLVETNFKGGDYGLVKRHPDWKDIQICLSRRDLKEDFKEFMSLDITEHGGEDPGIIIKIRTDGNNFTIGNDGVGFINSYYAEIKNKFIFSTSLHALIPLGLPLQWDLKGVSEYLSCLHQYEDRTLLTGAKLLPAGSFLKWKTNKSLEIKCNPLLMQVPTRSNHECEKYYISKFKIAWQQIIERIIAETNGSLTMGLSGGLDSRLIANGLSEYGGNLFAYTYGLQNTLELKSAQTVSKKLGLHHKVIWVKEADFLKNIDLCIQFLDGAHSAFELYESWYYKDIKEFNNTLLSGTSGDVFWGNESANGYESQDDLIKKKTDFFRAQLKQLESVIDDRYTEIIDTLLMDSISSSIKIAYKKRPFSNLLIWNLMNRQRRWGFCLNSVVRRLGISYFNPFFDKAFIAFINGLPEKYKIYGHLHLEIHKELYKETVRVPYSSSLGGPPPIILKNLYPPKRYDYFDIFKIAPDIGLRMAIKSIYKKLLFKIESRNKYARKLSRNFKRRNYVTNVFSSTKYYTNEKIYYENFNRIFEIATEYVPYYLSKKKLLSLGESMKKRQANIDPNMIGRVLCLCLWEKKWRGKKL